MFSIPRAFFYTVLSWLRSIGRVPTTVPTIEMTPAPTVTILIGSDGAYWTSPTRPCPRVIVQIDENSYLNEPQLIAEDLELVFLHPHFRHSSLAFKLPNEPVPGVDNAVTHIRLAWARRNDGRLQTFENATE